MESSTTSGIIHKTGGHYTSYTWNREKYQQYQTDKLHGRILTPDGLRILCAGLDNDPEKIGIHMLEMLAKFRNEGIVE